MRLMALMILFRNAEDITRSGYRQEPRRPEDWKPHMLSFKTKLVVYFLLISFLPLGGVFWAFSSLVTRDATHRADVRLEAAVRLGLSAFDAQLAARAEAAENLAREPAVQRALER